MATPERKIALRDGVTCRCRLCRPRPRKTRKALKDWARRLVKEYSS